MHISALLCKRKKQQQKTEPHPLQQNEDDYLRTLGTQPQASWSLRTDKVTSVTPSYHLPSASLRVVLSCITDPVATPPPSCPAPSLAFQSIFPKHFGELRLFRVSSQGLTINLSLLQAPRFQLSGLTVPRAQELVLSLWIFPSFHPDYNLFLFPASVEHQLAMQV